MPTFQKFDSFIAAVHNKVHNLSTDTVKVFMTNTAPVASNTILANITEISYANVSSRTLTGVTSTQTAGIYKLIADDLLLTASGAVGPFRYIGLYNDTATADELICWADYGSSITLGNADTFNIDLNQTEGVIKTS